MADQQVGQQGGQRFPESHTSAYNPIYPSTEGQAGPYGGGGYPYNSPTGQPGYQGGQPAPPPGGYPIGVQQPYQPAPLQPAEPAPGPASVTIITTPQQGGSLMSPVSKPIIEMIEDTRKFDHDHRCLHICLFLAITGVVVGYLFFVGFFA